MLRKLLINPFYLYAISFLFVFSVLLLNWSNSFGISNNYLIAFILVTSILSVILGYIVGKFPFFNYYPKTKETKAWFFLGLIFVGYIAEIAYTGSIPFLDMLHGTFDKDKFGIPTFHTILVSFNSYYTVSLFSNYLTFKKKKYLLFLLISVSPSVFLVNRIIFMMALLSCSFAGLLYIKQLKTKLIIISGLFVIILLYLFGLFGNYRSFYGNKNVLLNGTDVNKNFEKGKIPVEFYWSYIYAGSPLANLNYHIESTGYKVDDRIKSFFITQLLPDFISKRVALQYNIEKKPPPLIYYFLNATTIYSESFYYIGWWGLIIMFLFLMIFYFLYILFSYRYKEYYIEALAILLTLCFLNIFSNMLYYSGLSFQLVYPILFGILGRYRFTFNKTASTTL